MSVVVVAPETDDVYERRTTKTRSHYLHFVVRTVVVVVVVAAMGEKSRTNAEAAVEWALASWVLSTTTEWLGVVEPHAALIPTEETLMSEERNGC